MEELIEFIEKQKYSRTKLLAILEREYNQSKTIRKDLKAQFEVFAKTLEDFDPEYDAGFDSAFDMRFATQTLESYTDDRKLNAEGRKNTIWDFGLKNALFGWEMQRAYYSYKAHEIVLTNELRRMSWKYND